MGGEIQNTIINNNIATGHASKVTCEQGDMRAGD